MLDQLQNIYNDYIQKEKSKLQREVIQKDLLKTDPSVLFEYDLNTGNIPKIFRK